MSKVALINRFPREMARPFKDIIVWDLNEVNQYINSHSKQFMGGVR